MENKNFTNAKKIKIISLRTHEGASVHAIAMRLRLNHDEVIKVLCDSTIELKKETETYIIIESKMNYSNNLKQ